MKIKCVVLSYNHPELTRKCVSSALRFFEASDVVLVHNGSDEKNAAKLQAEFAGVDHLVLSKNMHYSGGANRGLSHAFTHADRVLFLTNDCELEAFQQPVTERPGHFITAPFITVRGTGRVDSFGGRLDLSTGKLSHRKDLDTSFSNERRPSDTIVNYIPGTAFLISKSAFQTLGGFDESLGTYWEDVDLSIRAGQSGVSLFRDSSIRVRHGVGKTCHKDPYYTTYLFQRNARIVSRRHARGFARVQLEISLGAGAVKLLTSKIRRGKFRDIPLLLRAL